MRRTVEDQKLQAESEEHRETLEEVLRITEDAYQTIFYQMRMLNDGLKKIHPSLWLGILSNATVLTVNFYSVLIMVGNDSELVDEFFQVLRQHFAKVYEKRKAQVEAMGEAEPVDGWLTVLPDDFIQ